jgi:hypothetical protein
MDIKIDLEHTGCEEVAWVLVDTVMNHRVP